MKFNKGQLVEVVKTSGSKSIYVGDRFIVTTSEIINLYMSNLDKWEMNTLCYDTGVKSFVATEGINDPNAWIKEEWIKAVNPDNDEQSDFTFNELMSDLTKSNQLTHNTK